MRSRKKLLYSIIFLIATLQCLFLGSIIHENQHQLFGFSFIFLFIFLVASYFHTFIKEYKIEYESWKIGAWIFIGAISVWLLRMYIAVDPVLAVGIIGLTAGGLPIVFKHKYVSQIPAAIYCGAFIAMSNIQNDLYFLLLSSTFTSLTFIFSKTILNGIGGKLGTLAFIGVVLAYLTYNIIQGL